MLDQNIHAAAVVLAAGSGKRMKSSVKKQYLLIDDKPILYYTLKAFERSDVREIILVTGKDEIEYCKEEIVEKYGITKVSHIVAGGAERYHSVYEGLLAIGNCDYVLIHDGARPLITPEMINKNIDCAMKEKACVTAVPSKDTVKISDDDGFIEFTPDRSRVWIIQTPQSFEYALVRKAYEKMFESGDENVTDDAMVVEKFMNQKIRLLEGEYTNIKLTTPEDLDIAKNFLGLVDK